MSSFAPDLVRYSSILIVFVCLCVLLVKFVQEYIGGTLHVGKPGDRLTYRDADSSTFQPLPRAKLWKILFFYFAVSRILIFVGTYCYKAITIKAWPPLVATFIKMFKIYDTEWYLGIAQFGYRTTGHDRLSICFYPLYPALVKLFHYVIPGYFTAGVVVSNLFLLIALYYLVRLVEGEYKDSQTGILAAKLLLLFPFSFFFSIAYTESVFIAFTILTFYALRRKKWLLAGLFAMLASLTRNQGVLLVLPILIEILYDHEFIRSYRNERGYRKGFLSGMLQRIAAVLFPFVGIGIYVVINKVVTGHWFQFLVYQREHWKQKFGFFADLLARHTGKIFTGETRYAFGIWMPGILLFFVGMILIIVCAKKLRLSYAAYALVYLVISFSPTGLLSGPRYVGGLFVLYLMGALLLRKAPNYVRSGVDIILAFTLCFYSILFVLKFVF
ncbi:glycosyltransferase family 39 protein [Gorillibacterium timonense]|uniref:glycosyltransferase family 39 protein n=1 Tax=Gorillibacterium timonense TaxID=1689269 RepID=UPI00071C52F5|nr:glycosyltransferase family 39 protein [Gorillibacterium timonense]